MTTPKRPMKLGTKARALWDDILGGFELGPHELRLLEDACREVDLIERLEVELRDAPLTVRGSQGQQVASPLVQELRQHRGALKGLLAALNLPDDGRAAVLRQTRARRAAGARWAN